MLVANARYCVNMTQVQRKEVIGCDTYHRRVSGWHLAKMKIPHRNLRCDTRTGPGTAASKNATDHLSQISGTAPDLVTAVLL